MRKNVSGQFIYFEMLNKTTGDPITTGTPAVDITIGNAAPIVGAGVKTHKTKGQWVYAPAQAETNGNNIGFTMSITNGINQTLTYHPVSIDPTSSSDLGITALIGHFPQSVDNDVKIGLIPTTPMRGTNNVPLNPALATDYTPARAGKLDNLDATISSAIANQTTIKDRIGAFTGTGTNNILGFFRSLFRSDIGTDPTDIGGTFDSTTDSAEATRDHGDLSWITGGGGGITDMLNVYPIIPMSVDLADTATVRLGLMLTNGLDDLPSIAEIEPGKISIHRKAIGGTSWVAVVTDAVCLELAGLIYFDEVFDAASGYGEGDSLRITFKSQKITVVANDYEIIGTTGRFFYTEVRQVAIGGLGDWTGAEKENIRSALGVSGTKTTATGGQLQAIPTTPMRGTDGANTTAPNTVIPLAANLTATQSKQNTAQSDLNLITGADGATLATLQGNYAPAKAGDAMAVSDKTGFSLSAAGILAVWDRLTSGFLIAGSIGKLIKDFLNASISSRASQVSLDTKISSNLSFIGPDVKVTLDGETVTLSPGTHIGATIPAVLALSGHVAQTGDVFSQLPVNFKDLSIEVTTGKTQLTAANISAIWQRVMTEGYAAKGAQATPEQMMYMLWSALAEFFVLGTTMTARKIDGVTVSMTFGTDDALNPTSRARAT